MRQYSLLIPVWGKKNSHTLVTYCREKIGLVRKPYGVLVVHEVMDSLSRNIVTALSLSVERNKYSDF